MFADSEQAVKAAGAADAIAAHHSVGREPGAATARLIAYTARVTASPPEPRLLLALASGFAP